MKIVKFIAACVFVIFRAAVVDEKSDITVDPETQSILDAALKHVKKEFQVK